MSDFLGLSAQELSDIHQAVAEGMAFVELPVKFFKADTSNVDELYRESADGVDRWNEYAEVEASIRHEPDKERLTRMGLRDDVEMLLFIPRQNILDWEDANAATFEITGDMEFSCYAGRFEVAQEPRTDPLPVGTGPTTDYIGMVVVGIEARP